MKFVILSTPQQGQYMVDGIAYSTQFSKVLQSLGISVDDIITVETNQKEDLPILLTIKNKLINEKKFMVIKDEMIDQDVIESIPVILEQGILDFPIVFVKIYTLPYNVVFHDGRGQQFTRSFVQPKMLIDLGIYLLTKEILDFAESKQHECNNILDAINMFAHLDRKYTNRYHIGGLFRKKDIMVFSLDMDVKGSGYKNVT